MGAFLPPTESEYKKDTPSIFPRPKKVLILDDSVEICALIQRVADLFYIELVICHTMKDAMRIIQECIECREQKNFDAMILDIRISNGSGIDLYKHVSHVLPKTQVVFLTGYQDEVYRQQIEKIGPARVFYKSQSMNKHFLSQLFLQFGAIERNE